MSIEAVYTLVGLAAGTAAILAYGSGPSLERARNRRLLKAYPGVWRILALPESACPVLEGSAGAIQAGDYGWEAEPLMDDERIYLHGLTPDWKVVWYAGFLRSQLQYITEKPASQYYRHPYWLASPPPDCPYPVQQTSGRDLGFAVELERNWVQGRTIPGIVPTRSRSTPSRH